MHPDQAQVLTCDYVRKRENLQFTDDDVPAHIGGCCGDGVCGDAETTASCPTDCSGKARIHVNRPAP